MPSIKTNTAVVHTGRSRSGLPPVRRSKLKYCEVAATGSLSALATFVMSANNLFDPNNSGTGHQPLGFDQWALFYESYMVEKSRMRVYVIPDSATQTSSAVAALYISDSNSLGGVTDWRTICEQPNVAWKALHPDWDNPLSGCVLYAEYDAKKFFNLKDIKDNEERIGGLVTAAPADEVFFHVISAPLNAATYAYEYAIEIEYDVIWSKPKQLAAS